MSYRKAFDATAAALVVSLIAPVLSLAPAAAAPKSETGLPIEITKARIRLVHRHRCNLRSSQLGHVRGGLRRRGSLLRRPVHVRYGNQLEQRMLGTHYEATS